MLFQVDRNIRICMSKTYIGICDEIVQHCVLREKQNQFITATDAKIVIVWLIRLIIKLYIKVTLILYWNQNCSWNIVLPAFTSRSRPRSNSPWNTHRFVIWFAIRPMGCLWYGIGAFRLLRKRVQLMSPWTEGPPFRRQYFQMHFGEWKVFILGSNFTKVCS